MPPQPYHIIIVGGGMVGMTLAAALAKQTNLSIAILEASPNTHCWQENQYYHRVSAIALSSINIFRSLGVWPAIYRKRVSPFTHIHVWDDVTRASIDFDSRDIVEPVLGYIIENAALQAALYELIFDFPQIHYIANAQLTQMQQSDKHIELTTEDGQAYSALLAIAADGAQSWLREQAGINVTKISYEQKAIVTTVTTTLPHQQTARQVFLSSGPLAFLPLRDAHTSSIVWSLPTAEADAKMALADNAFKEQLADAFSHVLGDISHMEARYAFPLQKQQASTYLKGRVVLAGDAAHAVHPLAGQGVNMGLLDAACLAEVIADAEHKQRDFASRHVLRKYERWRLADNAGLMMGIDAVKQLFASDKHTVRALRSHGLSIANSLPVIRNIFTRHAVGKRGDLPVLAR